MFRAIVCGLMLTAFAGAARAGELDREAAPAPAGPAKSGPTAPAAAGSELDVETPLQSHYWRHGWYGPSYGWGGYAPVRVSFGWGGFNPYFSPWGFGYSPAFYSPAFYSYRFNVGFGGFGYRPFYPAYYPVRWGGWYW
jgi:hypothetical protein